MPDVTLDLGNQYIGSAYSPQVAITDTEDGHEIDFTFADSEHPGQLKTEGFEVPNYSGEEAEREAAEAARAAAESARVAAEEGRMNRELDRVFNENARINAEELREDAETARASAEQARAAAETARASAEGSRASAEQARTSAESARASAEAGRTTAESARVSAEQARATAESARAAAESARVTAEAQRQTDTAAAITRADAATAAANTATANAQTATTEAQAATGEAETATDAANAAAALATAAAETVTDAYLPMVTAGAAEGITGGGPTDTAAWLQRACPGTDGPATIESIHGRTVRWNQLIGTMTAGTTTHGVTAARNGDGSATLSGTSDAAATVSIAANIGIIANHKYLIKGGVAGGTFNTYYLNVSGLGRDYGSGDIFTYIDNITGTLRYTFAAGVTFDNVIVWPQFFDLTAMFGAGNEPSTVAEFEALFREPYYPYDAGSLLSVQMEGIESADADGNVIQTRTIPATDLRSAGTVYDEQTATERITRVGAVDLGNKNWSKSGDYFYTIIDDKAVGAYNIICSKYTTSADGALENGECIGNSNNNRVSIMDTTYTDAAEFKTAMSGVMLHYELDTTTTTPIDPPLNLTYRAENGGTERIVHTDPTAAPTLVVTYGSTADGIRDRALACIAHIENGKASANYGVGSYLIHGGQLCRVTTAIATGEAITIGTNVVATTVMAELLTLTQ